MEEQILDALGVEVEIRMWRHRANTYEATFRDKQTGNPIDLTNAHAVMVIYDRSGGTQKFIQDNNEANHADPGNGVSRFYVPAATFTGLTGQRAYTWKYEVYRYPSSDSTAKVTHFYGDLRVMAPLAG